MGVAQNSRARNYANFGLWFHLPRYIKVRFLGHVSSQSHSTTFWGPRGFRILDLPLAEAPAVSPLDALDLLQMVPNMEGPSRKTTFLKESLPNENLATFWGALPFWAFP